MKPDERQLLMLLLSSLQRGERLTPRDAGVALGMHHKRVTGLCLKWAGRDFYDYGVSADLGFFNLPLLVAHLGEPT